MKKDNKNTELDNADKKLHISDVMRLLCNENMYNKSELHSSEIGDNGELSRVSIKETSFETGFMCARKIILDELNNNA
jgi:hypothetical protein